MVTPTNVDKSMIFSADTRRQAAPKILIRIPRTSSQSSSSTLSPAEDIPQKPSVASLSSKIDPLPIQHSMNTSINPGIQANSDWTFAPPLIETSNQKTSIVNYDTIHLGCFDYAPFRLYFPPKSILIGCTFNVLVKSGDLEGKAHNLAIKKRYIFGGEDGIYTDDSDIVLILRQQWQQSEAIKDRPFVKAKFMIMDKLDEYAILEKNGVKSRKWSKSHSGLSVKLISAEGSMGRSRQKNHHSGSHKKHQIKSTPMLPVIFSSISMRPLVPIVAVVPDNLRGHIEQTGFIRVESDEAEYSIEKSGSRSDNLFMIRCVKDERTVADRVEWSKIEWLPNGIRFHKTFLSLRGVSL